MAAGFDDCSCKIRGGMNEHGVQGVCMRAFKRCQWNVDRRRIQQATASKCSSSLYSLSLSADDVYNEELGNQNEGPHSHSVLLSDALMLPVQRHRRSSPAVIEPCILSPNNTTHTSLQYPEWHNTTSSHSEYGRRSAWCSLLLSPQRPQYMQGVWDFEAQKLACDALCSPICAWSSLITLVVRKCGPEPHLPCFVIPDMCMAFVNNSRSGLLCQRMLSEDLQTAGGKLAGF